MNVNCIYSGSSGNCYIIEDCCGKIMVEAGVPVKKIQKKWGYMVHGIQACLVSHEH